MDYVSNTLVCVLWVLEGIGGTLDCVLVFIKRYSCTFGCVLKATRHIMGSWGDKIGGDETFGVELGGDLLVGLVMFLKIVPSCFKVCKCY